MIAISYRREDSLPIAGRLYDRLQAKFGKKNVFMDFDSIPPGMDFREQIKTMIERSNLVIAIIGPNWLGEQPDASRRIDNAADFVRLEIVYALKRGIPIIPVLVNNTPMPAPEKLPQEIEGLAFRNAVTLDTGIDFHHHADRLIAGIGKAMAVAPRSGGPQKVSEPTGSVAATGRLKQIATWSPQSIAEIAKRLELPSPKTRRAQLAAGKQSSKLIGVLVAIGILITTAAISSWYFWIHRPAQDQKPRLALAVAPRPAHAEASVTFKPPEPPPAAAANPPTPSIAAASAAPTPAPQIALPESRVVQSNVYEGTIRAKNDSSTNVPLVITFGSDRRSGTMKQSGRRGDAVVKFTGIWDGATLHAVTGEVVSVPKGMNWEPESFTLRLANDGKGATYESFANGKTYVAELSARGTPTTINLAADREPQTQKEQVTKLPTAIPTVAPEITSADPAAESRLTVKTDNTVSSSSPVPTETDNTFKLVYSPAPEYPPGVDQSRVHGSGRFSVVFNDNGDALSVDVAKSTGHSVLDTNTINVLKKWRIAPRKSLTIIVPVTYAKPRSRSKP